MKTSIVTVPSTTATLPSHSAQSNKTNSLDLPLSNTIPSIWGVVFYGRRRNVKLLHVYLQRNLVKQGGILKHVSVLKVEFIDCQRVDNI